MINIEGLPKAEVLVNLYNGSKVQGMGILNATGKDMTIEEATNVLKYAQKLGHGEIYFDYLFGKVMKIDMTSDVEFDERLYDRDIGEGAAKAIIDKMRGCLK